MVKKDGMILEKSAPEGGYIPCPFGKGEGLGVG